MNKETEKIVRGKIGKGDLPCYAPLERELEESLSQKLEHGMGAFILKYSDGNRLTYSSRLGLTISNYIFTTKLASISFFSGVTINNIQI